jgi:hypothetical protein
MVLKKMLNHGLEYTFPYIYIHSKTNNVLQNKKRPLATKNKMYY